MGRKSKGKDRGYQTATEWREEGGGHKPGNHVNFKSLPFSCCAVTFLPFEDAACTADGTVYDVVNIVTYVQKFKRHPVNGEPLSLKDIITLQYHKNADGEYHCPVLNKVFTESTHIVAIRNTGNVYCYEAIEELNIKSKYWKDLLTDEPFSRKDIIHLQDPMNLAGRNMQQFDHVKRNLKLISDEEEAKLREDPTYHLQFQSDDTKRVMAALGTTDAAAAFGAGGGGKKAQAQRLLMEARAGITGAATNGGVSAVVAPDAGERQDAVAAPIKSDPRLRAPEREFKLPAFKPGTATWNTDDPDQQPWLKNKKLKGGAKKEPEVAAAPAPVVPSAYMTSAKLTKSIHTTGAASRSFTSSAVNPTTRNEALMIRVERKPAKKGYMRLHTNMGDLNLELHCNIVPRACENFLILAESGYYSNTIFHRSIKNFMIQGGDPTGTGTGGESVYGKPFWDEFDSRLSHSGRGILAMANSGQNSNGSQFFILYKSAPHLDFKHTVFGSVVGGLETLTKMERVPVDDDDRPRQEIKITGATIFVNPFKDEMEAEAKAEEEKRKEDERLAGPMTEDEAPGQWFSRPGGQQDDGQQGGVANVGKYLAAKQDIEQAPARLAVGKPAANQKRKQMTDFDAW